MKRAKILLTSIAVVAIVSGALAFKANRVFTDVYCATGAASSGTSCILQQDKTFVPGELSTDQSYCTSTDPGTSGICNTRSHLVDQQ